MERTMSTISSDVASLAEISHYSEIPDGHFSKNNIGHEYYELEDFLG